MAKKVTLRADTMAIDVLLDKCQNRQIRIPGFQRQYRWDRFDAQKLLDSIYNEYPIGTLFLWKNTAKEQEDDRDVLWVVDGQQRIRTLQYTMIDDDNRQEIESSSQMSGAKKDQQEETVVQRTDLRFYFDLKKQEIVEIDDEHGNCVPMQSVLGDLFDWYSDYPETRKDKEKVKLVNTLLQRFRDYKIPCYMVETDDIEAVREIFLRINNTGKSLKSSEIFHGSFFNRTQETPDRLDEIAKDVSESHNFGMVDEDILMQILLDGLGLDNVKDLNKIRKEERKSIIEQTAILRRTYECVVQFLQQDCYIPHITLLPYEKYFIPLARFFRFYPDPHPRARELLSRWVWRGILSEEPIARSGFTKVFLSLINGEYQKAFQGEFYILENILKQHNDAEKIVKNIDKFCNVMSKFNFRSAQNKVQVLAMLAQKPIHLQSGQEIIFHEHIASTPDKIVTYLQKNAGSKTVNRFVHPNLSKPLAILLEEYQEEQYRERWLSHCIDISGIDFGKDITELQINKLIKKRGELLQNKIQEFLLERTMPDDPDAPSMEYILEN